MYIYVKLHTQNLLSQPYTPPQQVAQFLTRYRGQTQRLDSEAIFRGQIQRLREEHQDVKNTVKNTAIHTLTPSLLHTANYPQHQKASLDQKDQLDQRNLLDLLDQLDQRYKLDQRDQLNQRDQLDQRTCCTRRPVWARGPEDLSALTCPNLHNRGLFERHSHTRIIQICSL